MIITTLTLKVPNSNSVDPDEVAHDEPHHVGLRYLHIQLFSFLLLLVLTLKAPITTAADDIYKYFFRENKT